MTHPSESDVVSFSFEGTGGIGKIKMSGKATVSKLPLVGDFVSFPTAAPEVQKLVVTARHFVYGSDMSAAVVITVGPAFGA
ncbi:hypothetical protein [Burkholderia gladioli]|uniref:hypothetical protein n=1 Tax=Burkholderia gladioli TaxID=28095 RepID=UPI00163F8086|nr:hypothetical protein [Burkholderia gladioli]